MHPPRPAWLLLLAGVAVTVAGERAARACANCSCGDPTLTVLGTEQPFRNRIRAALEFRHRIDEVGQGPTALRLSEQRLDAQVAWAPNRRVFLLATVPSLRREISYGGSLRRNSWGIGDAELRAKIFLFQDRALAPRHLVAAVVGVKLPTAALERDQKGDLLPIEVQTGTGSWDPLAGLSYGFFAFPWLVYASTTVAVSTTGTSGFRASRSLHSTVSVQRHILNVLAFRLSADTRFDGKAIENGARVEDSGGFVAFASPQVLISPTMDLTVSLYARLAVLNRLDGRHVEPYVVGAAVAYDF